MKFTAAEVRRRKDWLKARRTPWHYLPLPRPVMVAERGVVYCICGASVAHGELHSHGGPAFIVTDPERWGIKVTAE